MRDRFPLLLIGGLVLVGVLGTVVMKGARRGSFADQLSTYRSEPDGARAAFLLLEGTRQGAKVGRWQQSFDVIDPEVDLAVLAVPFAQERARMWRPPPTFQSLPDGGADDEEDDSEDEREEFRKRGFNALRAEPVSKDEGEKLLEHVRNGATVVYVPWGLSGSALLDALEVTLRKAPKKFDLRTLVPAQPTPYTLGVERVEARVEAYLDLPPAAVPVLLDEKLDEVIAAVVPYGQGKVLVLTAPELAMNSALTRADNALWWRAVMTATTHEGRPLLFDEYHHGFTGERSIGEFAARYGLQFAIGQLVFGAVLWAASLRRFGRPKSSAAELRVGATDALFATSRIYREGRHFAHAASAIVRELASELAAKAGMSPRAEPEQISAGLELRGRKDLARALLDVSHQAARASKENDVQHVARLAALLRRKLQDTRRATK